MDKKSKKHPQKQEKGSPQCCGEPFLIPFFSGLFMNIDEI